MSTNQTIDGVPRKILTAILCKLDEFNNRALVAELRALLDVSLTDEGEKPANPKPTGLSQGWNLTRKHDGFVVGHQSMAYPPDEKAIQRAGRGGYVWVPFRLPAAQHQDEPVREDRETLIGYGRSSGLDEASTLCARLAYAAYYPPGTRFKAFTPKAQKALGDLLIKAASAIASLPGGPYERFKARQAKKAESAKSR